MASRNRFKDLTRRILAARRTTPTSRSEIRDLRWAQPLLLATASGILLALSFPGWNADAIAWCALMPLVYGILRFPESAFRQGFVAGVVFFWASIYWLWHVTVAGWLCLGVYMALFIGAWAWGMAQFRKIFPDNTGAHHLRLAAFGAVSWTALEWLRGHFLSGFPWNP